MIIVLLSFLSLNLFSSYTDSEMDALVEAFSAKLVGKPKHIDFDLTSFQSFMGTTVMKAVVNAGFDLSRFQSHMLNNSFFDQGVLTASAFRNLVLQSKKMNVNSQGHLIWSEQASTLCQGRVVKSELKTLRFTHISKGEAAAEEGNKP